MNNSLPIEPGARFLHPHTGHFLLWAPRGNQAILRLVGPVHRDIHMTRHDHGYWEATVDGIHPGQRYFYRLDNGPDRPDPASRAQPDGVHGPSAVVNTSFDWHDNAWTGAPLDSLVLYELHVGTFTPQGTFDAVLGQLDRLCDLGVTALSLMPVAQFPGWRNWGYDGVYPFCVQNSYGGPAGLKRLVDAAHARGLSVLLDIVYNHLGPEGNYFRYFGPYFTDNYRTPWGEPLNFDSHGCDAVRDFFLANARMWQVEFHLDGLRIDAVPWIKDFSASHLLADLADQARALIPHTRRPFHLIGESDMNDPRVIRPRAQGGFGLDAQWSDDFHHALHAYLTGERGGYYADHGPLENLARAYQDAYVLTGQYSHFRRRRYGTPATDCAGRQFVIFAQNHDQVGNRPRGDRLSTLVDFETLKLIAATLLTAPYVPMLFMGEEYGETAPFPFFIHHGDGGLIDRIRRGRRGEFIEFGWHIEPYDPADEATFRRAHLDVAQATHGRGRALHDWHRELLRLRRELPTLANLDRRQVQIHCLPQEHLLVIERGDLLLGLHFAQTPGRRCLLASGGTYRRLLDSSDARWHGPGAPSPQEWRAGDEVALAPRSFVLYQRVG